MSDHLTGGCQCGGISYAITGDGQRDKSQDSFDFTGVHICHCRMCRRAVGNLFAVWLAIDTNRIEIVGSPKAFRSSPFLERLFCGECGTPIGSRYVTNLEGWPYSHLMGILVGTLDDPERVRPDYHFGVESKISWVDMCASLPQKRTDELEGFDEHWRRSAKQFPSRGNVTEFHSD